MYSNTSFSSALECHELGIVHEHVTVGDITVVTEKDRREEKRRWLVFGKCECVTHWQMSEGEQCTLIRITRGLGDNTAVQYVCASKVGDFLSISILERCQLKYRYSLPI